MGRSFWKGNTILPIIYETASSTVTESSYNWIFSKLNFYPRYRRITLYRRSQILTSSILNLGLKFKIYNGYDFFDKAYNAGAAYYNLGDLILTRETRVVHKVKLSKEAKKNQQMKLNKKKASASSKKVKIKTKKVTKKKD